MGVIMVIIGGFSSEISQLLKDSYDHYQLDSGTSRVFV